MKLGVFTPLFNDKPFAAALDYIASLGLDSVEVGTGNYPGGNHCPLDELVASKGKAAEWKKQITSRGLTLEALSCHGNALHPDKKFAKANHAVHRKTIKLAAMLGVPTVVEFAGCPGDSDKAAKPNWVTCAWPPDFSDVLKWQWDRKVLPYWTTEAKFAKAHGVRIAFEAHPGFVVYNPETLLRLREACGDSLGCNFDPSHFFWQGIDPLAAAKALRECIFHVHAKDTRIDPENCAVNGNLDTKGYDKLDRRSWIFRTVGYGHGESWWRDFVSTLRVGGYDGVLSIEHEDALMSPKEGFEKAVSFLKGVMLREGLPKMWWA
ncbi:MAG: sugar phosphate isomerase/epimerase [Phycisphaerae bacterium]|nr:sugar phosphate isomerase/epimerase [Phycisphaerae bacterium]